MSSLREGLDVTRAEMRRVGLSGIVKPIIKPMWEQTNLERATSIAVQFEPVQRTMWSSQWPFGHCMNAALLLAPLIRIPLEWEVAIVVGAIRGQHKHAWIESPDGDIIDSAFYFDSGPPLRVLSARNGGKLGHAPEVRLSPEHEEHFRSALKPHSGFRGWRDASGIYSLFSDFPRLPHLPKPLR